MTVKTLYSDETGPRLAYNVERGFLHVEDLNPHVQTKWRMSRWEMVKLGFRMVVVACLLAGCVGTRHADQNRDYDRNCGPVMDELLLCSALPGGRQ